MNHKTEIMKRSLLFTISFAMVVLSYSCKSKNAGKTIIGKWVFEKIQTDPSITVTDDNKNIGDISATFKEDGSFISIMKNFDQDVTLGRGTYQIINGNTELVTNDVVTHAIDTVKILELTDKTMKIASRQHDTIYLKKVK